MVETPFGRVGLYSCMDGVINETPRMLAVEGAQVLLNSLNSFALDEASLHVPVRAVENRVWVVAANKVGPLVPDRSIALVAARVGVPADLLHGAGESQIVAPDGRVVACGPRRGEAVVIADLDVEEADDKTRPDGTEVLAARRPELYGPIAEAPRGRRAPAGADTLPTTVVCPGPGDDVADPAPGGGGGGRGSRGPARAERAHGRGPARRAGRHLDPRRHQRAGRGAAPRGRRGCRRGAPLAAAAARLRPARAPGDRPRRCARGARRRRGADSRSWSATTRSTRRRSGWRPSRTPTWSRCRSASPAPTTSIRFCSSGRPRTGSTSRSPHGARSTVPGCWSRCPTTSPSGPRVVARSTASSAAPTRSWPRARSRARCCAPRAR